jgi:tryptophan 2,3-dioxygenase
MARSVSYWDYIRVDDLLALQGGVERDESLVENDEAVFIVVHQVYELWFKLMLRELSSARDLLKLSPVPDERLANAVRTLRRVVTILRQAISHFDVVETLTTRDFLAFRDRLIPASGFQSAQLRELEILLGLDDADRIHLGREGSWLEALKDTGGGHSTAHERVLKRLDDRPTLREVLHEWLFRTPIDGSSPEDPDDVDAVQGFLAAFLRAHEGEAESRLAHAAGQGTTPGDVERLRKRYQGEIAAARAFLHAEDVVGPTTATFDPSAERRRQTRIRAALVFIESYRELPLLAWPRELVDTVLEVEQHFVMYRQRHARMVERVIGRRTGTGGSAGVDYLDATASYRVFRNFWAVRTLLLREAVLPPLAHPETYEFRFRSEKLGASKLRLGVTAKNVERLDRAIVFAQQGALRRSACVEPVWAETKLGLERDAVALSTACSVVAQREPDAAIAKRASQADDAGAFETRLVAAVVPGRRALVRRVQVDEITRSHRREHGVDVEPRHLGSMSK